MKEIKNIQVFGARCSGTNWLESLMRDNYPVVEVMDRKAFGGRDNFGWKHGDLGSQKRMYVDNRFIRNTGNGYLVFDAQGIRVPTDDQRYVGVDNDGDMYIKNNALPLDEGNPSDKLFVVVYRNPLTWLQSLHREPHHALALYDSSFTDFVSQPWQTYHSAPGMSKASSSERQRWIDKGVILEDQASVFDHRRKSIEITESFTGKVPNVVYVNYETALQDPEQLITTIAINYGIQTTSLFQRVDSVKGKGKETFEERPYEPLSQADLLVVLSSGIVWDTEEIVGYSQKSTPSTVPVDLLSEPSRLVSMRGDTRFYRDGQLLTP